jgi:hypothetical protein
VVAVLNKSQVGQGVLVARAEAETAHIIQIPVVVQERQTQVAVVVAVVVESLEVLESLSFAT